MLNPVGPGQKMGVFLSFIGIIGETLVMPSAPSSVRKHIVWTISDKRLLRNTKRGKGQLTLVC